jgi:preprotein translocase SecE subunit
VARDRKRAKQRRDRGAAVARRSARAERAANGAHAPEDALAERQDDQRAPAQTGVVKRADLPGSLDHAGAEVDEFDAALVRGAAGVPATDQDQAELDAEVGDALQEPAGAGGSGGLGGTGAGGGGGRFSGDGVGPSGAPLRGGNRAIGFLRASWAELQRVQWPDRRQVTQATAVVLGFVAIAGLYLGAADTVAKEIVEFIL